MRVTEKQKGMTLVGWLLTIAVIIFFLIILVKLMPVYLERFSVRSVMSSLENDVAVRTMESAEISNTILRRLKTNMVDSVTKEDIYITHTNNQRIIELDYEVRRNLFGNHDIVVKYLSRIEVQAQ